MRARSLPLPIVFGALILGVAGVGVWFLTLTQPSSSSPSPSWTLLVEEESVVGEDLTEGEATAWTNAPKLAVDPQGGLHVVYQYAYGKRGEPDRVRYARSPDGREWKIVAEWTGRYPTTAADREGRVYIAYVERSAQGDRLWLIQSDSSGDKMERLLDEGPPRTRAFPALLVGEDTLWLAWEVHEPSLRGHRVELAEISLQDGEIRRETVAEAERGLFFPTLARDRTSHKVYLAWQAAEDARRYRIEVAVREAGGWRVGARLTGEGGDGRSPALAPHSEGGLTLAFVSLRFEGEKGSSLYVARIPGDGGPHGKPVRVASRSQGERLAAYAEEVIAFPTAAGGLVVWGHTVPAACGTGPLFWSLGDVPQGELVGAFASYPHLVPDPLRAGIYHLVWTDRVAEELRAFQVRYARLKLIPRSGR